MLVRVQGAVKGSSDRDSKPELKLLNVAMSQLSTIYHFLTLFYGLGSYTVSHT